MGVAGGPDLIQDGLVLSFDASDRNSYVSGSTTWFDLSGLNNSGSLINGPTFSSDNLGSIVLDGVDDYIDCGTNSMAAIRGSSQFTLNYWFKKFSSGNDFLLGAWDQTASKGFFIQWFSDSNVYFGVSNGARSYSSVGLSYTSNWYNFHFGPRRHFYRVWHDQLCEIDIQILLGSDVFPFIVVFVNIITYCFVMLTRCLVQLTD
jgi:hypothetical protein